MKIPNTHLLWICGMALLLGCYPLRLYAQEPEYLNVHTTGDTNNYSISLNELHKITFDESRLTLWGNEGTHSLLYNHILKITFGETLVGIEEIELTDKLHIHYRSSEQQIVIRSQSPIESLALYNLQGRLLQQLTPRVESLILPMHDYPTGIYIVRATNKETIETTKIIKP